MKKHLKTAITILELGLGAWLLSGCGTESIPDNAFDVELTATSNGRGMVPQYPIQN